jgi:hypothetical protein
MGGCKSLILFLCGGFFCFVGKKDSQLCFCFFMLRKKRGGNMYGIYAMAASGRMQYDYKQNKKVNPVKISTPPV